MRRSLHLILIHWVFAIRRKRHEHELIAATGARPPLKNNYNNHLISSLLESLIFGDTGKRTHSNYDYIIEIYGSLYLSKAERMDLIQILSASEHSAHQEFIIDVAIKDGFNMLERVFIYEPLESNISRLLASASKNPKRKKALTALKNYLQADREKYENPPPEKVIGETMGKIGN